MSDFDFAASLRRTLARFWALPKGARADYERVIKKREVEPNEPQSEYERKVAQMKADFPNGI